MNEQLKIAGKYKHISLTIFYIFLILTIVSSIVISYSLNNYWILFGILFALYLPKFNKLFLFSTIGVIIYWYKFGFHFSDLVTLFWIFTVFGFIFQMLIQTYKKLADTIIDIQVSEMSKDIIDSIRYNNEISNNKSEIK